jgi:hypothetical protein
MKYDFLLKLSMCVLIIFTCLQYTVQVKKKSRFQVKVKLRNRVQGKSGIQTVVKIKNNKKDGPLLWGTTTEDDILERFLKNERSGYNNNNYHNENINNFSSQFTNSGNSISSENQKSKTFRSVSPYEDSTRNSNGKVYSQIFKTNHNGNFHPGYYGKSRLT